MNYRPEPVAIDLTHPVTYDTLPFGICEGKQCSTDTTNDPFVI